MRCRHCLLLFGSQHAFNSHIADKCQAAGGGGVQVSPATWRSSLDRTLPALEEHCGESVGTNSAVTCRYCGKPWLSQLSLSQHIRIKHMVESQRDCAAALADKGAQVPSRRVWTEDQRQAFLDCADCMGWSNHSVIAAHCSLLVHQVRNFKLKFSRS